MERTSTNEMSCSYPVAIMEKLYSPTTFNRTLSASVCN